MAGLKTRIRNLQKKLNSKNNDGGNLVIKLPVEKIENVEVKDRVKLVPPDRYAWVGILPERISNIDAWEQKAHKYCYNLWEQVLGELSWEDLDLSDDELKTVGTNKEGFEEWKQEYRGRR